VIGLLRAELLRLRRRRTLQVIVLAVPLLTGVIMVLGYNSIYDPPPFDEAAYRQELLDQGYGVGIPPEELEPLLHDTIESQRQMLARDQDQTALNRATFIFPYSLVLVLGSGAFVLFALILLTATTIGDEFGWATIRTALLASSRRRRFLLVRFMALGVAGIVIFGLLLLVGVVLPLVLNVPASKLPAVLPPFDGGAFLMLLAGELLAALLVIAFAALVTLVVRNGALTLVAGLVWVAVEAAILTLLFRFPNFSQSSPTGEPPPDAWLLEAFPLRGLTTLMQALGKAASGLPSYPGDVVSRDAGIALVPIVSFTILIVILAAASFRRFQRMDIVE
jgi:ABC-type transport system involved in multi-copper enzyme maturation permease subunit